GRHSNRCNLHPIKRVIFYVDSTRVGRMTDYDRLTMEVETDGSLTPEEAIAQASLLLKDHLNLFSFEEPAISNAGISTQALKIDQVSTDLLGKPVTDLDLSLRALSCLKNDSYFNNRGTYPEVRT
ncbi:DNA-directed RNA polymerase, alpha subunit, partial [mine drainage metagenome]